MRQFSINLINTINIFDSESKTSEAFTYGGCGGNENKFDSALECEDKSLGLQCLRLYLFLACITVNRR